MLARIGLALFASALPAVAQTVVLVSQSSGGAQGNGDSRAPRISADGNWVVFKSDASTLVGGDSNGKGDVFLRDLANDTTVLISFGVGGAPANGESFSPSINSDGTVIAFQSAATNLVTGDTNGKADIFVWDAGVITRVSLGTGGVQANGASDRPSVSGDGRYVAFESVASNLVTGDSNGASDIFRFDRVTGSIVRASVSSTGAEANGPSYDPSTDGTRIAFTTWATNLFANDSNNTSDVVVRNEAFGTTESPLALVGVTGNGASDSPSFTWNIIAFRSDATNIVPNDTNGLSDVYLVDLGLLRAKRVSAGQSGAQANGASDSPEMSATGEYVCFSSAATNLVPGDLNNHDDVFRFRWCPSPGACGCGPTSTTLISADAYGVEGSGHSRAPSIDAWGTRVVFKSDAGDLVAGDINGTGDVFVRRPAPVTWHVDSQAASPGAGSPASPFTDLQYALDNDLVFTGDTVLVYPGTYFGGFNLNGKLLELRSTNGSSVTYLDGHGAETVLRLLEPCNEEETTTIAGFTIQNGFATQPVPNSCGGSTSAGGGIAAENTALAVDDCLIRNCSGGEGAAICAGFSSLVLSDSVIQSNVCSPAQWSNSAVMVSGSGPPWGATAIINSAIRDNDGHGVYLCSVGEPPITNCTIEGNEKYGVALGQGNCVMQDSTVRGNGEGGLAAFSSSDGTVRNSVVQDNVGPGLATGDSAGVYMFGGRLVGNSQAVVIDDNETTGAECELHGVVVFGNGVSNPGGGSLHAGSQYTRMLIDGCTVIGNVGTQTGTFSGSPLWLRVVNSIVWGNTPTQSTVPASATTTEYSDLEFTPLGIGCIQTGPQLWDAFTGDAHLIAASPCIDAGDPAAQLDPDGSRADMGASPFDPNYCGTPRVYCTAKVNSKGCTPSIGWMGSPSLNGPNDDFHVTASNVLSNKNGILFWGTQELGAPFQGGTLCVKPPIVRTDVQNSGGNPAPTDCSGSYGFHLTQTYLQQSLFQPGTTIYAQYWSRDQGFAPPNNVGLTDGLRIVVCP